MTTTDDNNRTAGAALVWTMRACALAATLVSGYLCWVTFSGGSAVGCGAGGFDCAAILSSPWSRWLGLPVAAPAVSLFVSLLVLLAFCSASSPPAVRGLAWDLATWLSAIAAASAVWFVSLQAFWLRSFCGWCMTVHGCAALLMMMALVGSAASVRRKALTVIAGLAAFALLPMGQFWQPPMRWQLVVERIEYVDGIEGAVGADEVATPPSADTEPAPAGTEPDAAATHRWVQVLGGRAKVDVFAHPVLGDPAAQHVVVKLFDYTCPHCRLMHEHLKSARKHFGEQFAVVMLPTPMDADCNPAVKVTDPHNRDACALARLALAVWQAKPTRFETFDDWLFSQSQPPAVDAARAKAESLVGKQALAEALDDWRLSERLGVGIQLHNLSDQGVIPKVLLPQVILRGRSEDREEVLSILASELHMQPAAPSE